MSVKRMPFVVLVTSLMVLVTGVAPAASDTDGPKGEDLKPEGLASATSRLGPEIDITSNIVGDERRPAAVYNRHRREYLVVYESGSGRIWGSPVLLSGLVGWFTLSSPSAFALHPAVAFNRHDDEYLVVWQQYNTGLNKWEIYGLIFPGSGPDFSVPPFQIAQWSGLSLKLPAVAWNSYRNEYMVVWQTEDMSSQLVGIGRRRVRANGDLAGSADYVRQASFPGSPDIAYNPATDAYLVVWAQLGNHYIDIYGGRLSWEGALQSNVFPIGQASDEQQLPAVTTNEQDRYLVVWQDKRWGDWDIYGQLLDASGNLVGGEIWVTGDLEDDTQPAVAANGAADEYLVAWQQGNPGGERIVAELLDASGSWKDFVEVAPGAFGDNGHPAVATHLAGYLIAYDWASWEPNATTDVYGRMWSPHAAFLPMVVRSD